MRDDFQSLNLGFCSVMGTNFAKSFSELNVLILIQTAKHGILTRSRVCTGLSTCFVRRAFPNFQACKLWSRCALKDHGMQSLIYQCG